ncbi:MAG: hypothetical protein GX594_16075 [Pirellulaceae bacterium]|nr:hypothetical protein [Pirellulaceae bacterium]
MSATELLLDLGRLGIRLEADGERLRYRPRSALTPDLLGLLKAYKTELLALLRPVAAVQAEPMPTTKPTAKPVCRCGSTVWRDVPIHNGQSVRRDCGRCGRFLDFPVWYGNTALQTEKYPVECQHDQETIQTNK